MKVIRDCFGRSVRLTDERTAHILQHPEMVDMEAEIALAVQSPLEGAPLDLIRPSGYFTSTMPAHVVVRNGCASW